ncbi:argininosuccinate lyase [Paracoccus onubensis]|uniref:argininosuccinate lyase n=1 Tax=Paracoccus onubensis TaxID=1675788 RepID=UPI00273200E5|nr:argininosuccinate lyase [Paracoccus onubensis]MDP0930303.1 argininosuccinate lyase [Paracoccus onubensis]
MTALTTARLGKSARPSLIEAVYKPIIDRDLTMFNAYMEVDLTHVVMMTENGIISPEAGKSLLSALLDLEQTGPAPLNIDPSMGSLLLQVERYLAEKAGQDTAGVLQLARSRIDQNAAISRVDARNRLLRITRRVFELQEIWRRRASEWTDVIMPGYTHLQHAQPWVLAHYALYQYDVFARDVQRLLETYARTNMSSLGGVALAGTSWPIDRDRTSELLGHSAQIRNSKDCGGFAMDYLAEVASALSILMSGLGRSASELYVWASWEFGLIELDEGLCGTSSIMPQKKNPYVLERIRALAGESIGWMPSQLGMLRTPTTIDSDRFFSSGNVQFFDVTNWALTLMQDTVATLRINSDVMYERAGAHWSTASSLADAIVKLKGLDFRRSHHIVGALVKTALENGISPSATTAADVDAAAKMTLGAPIGLTDEQVHEALDARHFVKTRVSAGSIGPEQIDRMAHLAEGDSTNTEKRLKAEESRILAASKALRHRARELSR